MGNLTAGVSIPDPGRWLVDVEDESLHWVEPGQPRTVCGQAGFLIEPARDHLRCTVCETWLRTHRPCPQCGTLGKVRVYRRRDHGPTRRVNETCGMCDGHGYRAA